MVYLLVLLRPAPGTHRLPQQEPAANNPHTETIACQFFTTFVPSTHTYHQSIHHDILYSL